MKAVLYESFRSEPVLATLPDLLPPEDAVVARD